MAFNTPRALPDLFTNAIERARMKTQAAILWEVGSQWSVEEVELDEPQHGEVLIRFAASGLCHSDEHIAKGDQPHELPVIGGHEGAGVIEAIGPGVQHLKPGDHVVTTFMATCGRCRWCASGQSMICDHGAGLTTGLPLGGGEPRASARGQRLRRLCALGTFSPYSVVHEDSCVRIDDDIPLELAALVGCGVPTGFGAAVHRAKVEPGDTVIVVGCGGVGINAVQGARIAGANTIIAIDPVEFHREQAKLFGATHSAASMQEAFPLVAELTRGVMADKTILAVDLMTSEMLMPLMLLTRKGGRACLTSVSNLQTTSADVILLDLVLSQKEIVGNVFGGCNSRADVPRLLSLYRSGQLKLKELVTKTYSLDQINEGYADMYDGKVVRGVITFD